MTREYTLSKYKPKPKSKSKSKSRPKADELRVLPLSIDSIISGYSSQPRVLVAANMAGLAKKQWRYFLNLKE